MTDFSAEKQLEKLEYDDAIISLFSLCQQYGARKVMEDFQRIFPDMFDEILVQINRIPPTGRAALLK